jgi:hypothetical protein
MQAEAPVPNVLAGHRLHPALAVGVHAVGKLPAEQTGAEHTEQAGPVTARGFQ